MTLSIEQAQLKPALTTPFHELVNPLVHQYQLELLPVAPVHVARVAALPPHHRDPFDRMLVPQAVEQDLTIVSCDTALDAYGVRRL